LNVSPSWFNVCRSTFGYLMVGFSSAEPWFFSRTCRKAFPAALFPHPTRHLSTAPYADNTFGEEPDHPDVHGSKNYRRLPLPAEFADVAVGEGYGVQGMNLSDSQGVLISECPDAVWVRTQRGSETCKYGIVVHTRDLPTQGPLS